VTASMILFALQIPFLATKVRHPSAETSPSAVVSSVSYTLEHPSVVRPGPAFRALTNALDVILARPGTFVWPGAILAMCTLVAAARVRRDPRLIAVTGAPLVFAVVGFSLWQQPYDTYWFLTVAPSAGLCVGLALTAYRPAASLVMVVLIAIVSLAQPSRAAEAMSMHRLPEYGALVRGSREILKRLGEVQRVEVSFPLPVSTEPDFVYKVLGGRLSPEARYRATIDRAGHASFVLAPAVAGRSVHEE
jgi:hypothetical protein